MPAIKQSQSVWPQDSTDRRKIMKKTAWLSLLIATVVAIATASLAETSTASVKGVYKFQIGQVATENGYYSGNTWYEVTGACPSGQVCSTQSILRYTSGTVSFDGTGHATFLSITSVNGGCGGFTEGSTWGYSIFGFNGAMGTATNDVHLTLGSFNSAGVATLLAIRKAGNSLNAGVGFATLQ
jgi:hypothetical protein